MHAFYNAAIYMGLPVYIAENATQIAEYSGQDSLTISEGTLYGKEALLNTKGAVFVHSPRPGLLESVHTKLTRNKVFVLDVFKKSATDYLELSHLAYFDELTNTLYQPWGTDLLPSCDPYSYYAERSNFSYYTGCLYGDSVEYASQVNDYLSQQSPPYSLCITSNCPTQRSRNLAFKSFVNFDFRDAWHREVAYIPCRIFKILSLGLPVITNSRHIKDFMSSDHVIYCDNPMDVPVAVRRAQNDLPRFSSDLSASIIANHGYVRKLEVMMSLV